MSVHDPQEAIRNVFRAESARLVGGLVRLVRDVGVAEELAQDALVAALEQWPESGIPNSPGAWLQAAARNRAINVLKRNALVARKHEQLVPFELERERVRPDLEAKIDDEVGDDVLRLILIACDPVLPMESRIALTLRLLPQRLTQGEVEAIGDMVQSTEHRHMSIRGLALHAQRVGKVFAHPGTWGKLIRERGWRRPQLRLYPAKPKVGLRTHAPNEAWHIDVTIIKLLDGTKAYVHAVIDNFSRKILAWTVAGPLDPMNTHDVLTRAAGHLVASTNVFMDSGVENLMLRNMQRAYETTGNERLRWFFDEIGLPIGPVEEKALKSRNQAVHPTKSHTSEEVRQFVRMANVYRMLLVRAVLKVLSWKGAYMATAR